MQGRKLGTVLTSGLLALALALAVLQATVLVHSTSSPERVTTSASGPQAPVRNGAVPWVPDPSTTPSEREGRTPGNKPPREQHRPGLRPPGAIPQVGPRPMRKAVA
jgi:hypothetical protein